MTMKVVIVGSTGAIGREVVKELISSPNYEKVIAFSRRKIPQDEIHINFPGIDLDQARTKLDVRVVNFDQLKKEDFVINNDKMQVPDATFWCLGTTRKDAGSAKNFQTVDLSYLTKGSSICHQIGINYFGLVSASNSDKNSYFLYPKTKGLCEEVVKAQGIPHISIFRPSLLLRGDLTRSVEKVASYIPFVPSIEVSDVAKSMVRDCEQYYQTEGKKKNDKDNKKESVVRIVTHSMMKEANK